MTELQDIYDQIGKLMVAAAVPDAKALVFEGKDYPSHSEGGPHWIRDDGSIGRYTRELSPPRGMEGDVMALVRKLKEFEPFASDQPFTHYRIELSDKMKFSIDFEHIPEEQSWPRVFMIAVGALSEEDARSKRVPQEHWLLRKKLHEGEISKDQFDAELAQIDSDFQARKTARGGGLG